MRACLVGVMMRYVTLCLIASLGVVILSKTIDGKKHSSRQYQGEIKHTGNFGDNSIEVNKRWVDVDGDDAPNDNGNREKTPQEPDLATLVGSFDQGLSNQLKSVNDIT